MRTFLISVGLALAVAALAGASAAFARAETTTRQFTEPVSFVGNNPCTGEAIEFSGTFYVIEHITVDAAGREHSTGHDARLMASGVGVTSGIRYVYSSGIADTSSFPVDSDAPGGTVTTTTAHTLRVISQGSGENYVLTGVFHHTIGSDGQLIVEFDRLTGECR